MESPRYETHVHTIYCGHADPAMTPEAIVDRARELGLEFVVITEHLHKPADLDRIDKIRADLVALGESPCPIYLGAEIDADSAAMDGSLTAPTEGLAYVLASTHQYPGGSPWWNHPNNLSASELATMIDQWFDWAAGIARNPAVDTMAHPGVLLAQNQNTGSFDEVLDRFADLFAIAAAHGTRIELNELAARKFTPAHRETYPKLLQVARDAGCRLIVSCDAHRPDQVAHFDWVLEVGDALGMSREDFVTPEWHAAPVIGPGAAA